MLVSRVIFLIDFSLERHSLVFSWEGISLAVAFQHPDKELWRLDQHYLHRSSLHGSAVNKTDVDP